MIDVEQKYKDLYTSYGGKELRLVFFSDEYNALYPSETLYPSDTLYPAEMDLDSAEYIIENNMIQSGSLNIKESLCSDENLDFGACESAQMEITISSPTQDIAGKEFVLIESFGDYSLSRGVYIVDSTPKQEDKDTRKVVAYDRMTRFDVDVSGWYEALEFPMTIRAFRDSLCAFCGVTQVEVDLVNDDVEIEKTLSVSVLNGRDVLRYICQINGAFGHMDYIGRLRYIEISGKDDYAETITKYQSAEAEEYTAPDIDTVLIREEEGDTGGQSTGDGANTYIIEGNFLVYGKTTSEIISIANNIRNKISGLEYRPAAVTGSNEFWLEMGDRILVETEDETINMVVMSRTVTGINGAMSTISAAGTQELNQVFNIDADITLSNGLFATIKKSAALLSAELTSFSESTTSRFTQTAALIRTEVTRATNSENSISSSITATAESLTLAVNEKVNVGEVTENLNSELEITGNSISFTTGHLIIDANNVTLDSSGDATFSGKITGGSININDVFTVDSSGNTAITGNHFSWSATNSSMNKDGTLTCKNITATDGTFTGTISGTTITGATIEAATIKAQSTINATTIESAKIKAGSELNIDYLKALPQLDSTSDMILTGLSGEFNLQYLSTAQISATDSEPSQIDLVTCTGTYYGPLPSEDSDARLKGDIVSLDGEKAIALLKALSPSRYSYTKNGIEGMGFIAQEVEEAQEQTGFDGCLYSIGKDGYYTIPYMNYIALLAAGIKNLKQRLDLIKERKGINGKSYV